MEKHINVISILWIVYGAMGILGAFVAFWILFGVTFIPHIGDIPVYILRGVAVFVGVLVAVLSIPELIAGFGLQKRKECARILTLVLCFLNLISFPLGTALSIYSFIILINDQTVPLFHK